MHRNKTSSKRRHSKGPNPSLQPSMVCITVGSPITLLVRFGTTEPSKIKTDDESNEVEKMLFDRLKILTAKNELLFSNCTSYIYICTYTAHAQSLAHCSRGQQNIFISQFSKNEKECKHTYLNKSGQHRDQHRLDPFIWQAFQCSPFPMCK